jgi:hypothetical protein
MVKKTVTFKFIFKQVKTAFNWNYKRFIIIQENVILFITLKQYKCKYREEKNMNYSKYANY